MIPLRRQSLNNLKSHPFRIQDDIIEGFTILVIEHQGAFEGEYFIRGISTYRFRMKAEFSYSLGT